MIGTRVGVPDGEREPVGVALVGVAPVGVTLAGGVRVGVGAGGVAADDGAGVGVGWLPADGRITGAVCRGTCGGTCGGIEVDAGGVGCAESDERRAGGVIGAVGRGGNAGGRTGGCTGGVPAGRAAIGFDGDAGRGAPPNGAGRPGPIGGSIVGRNGAGGVVPGKAAAEGDDGVGGTGAGGVSVADEADGWPIGLSGRLVLASVGACTGAVMRDPASLRVGRGDAGGPPTGVEVIGVENIGRDSAAGAGVGGVAGDAGRSTIAIGSVVASCTPMDMAP